jgi:hypothetical protein
VYWFSLNDITILTHWCYKGSMYKNILLQGTLNKSTYYTHTTM